MRNEGQLVHLCLLQTQLPQVPKLICLTKSSPPAPPLCSLTEPSTFQTLRVPHSSPKWQKNSPGEECEQVVSMLRYRVAIATAFRLWLHSLVMSSSDAGPTPAPPGVTGAKGSKLKTCKVEDMDRATEEVES